MSKPVSGLNVFQNQAGPIPLSQLDANFTSVTNALNDLSTYSNYVVDASGAANTITVTVAAPLVFAYSTGIELQIRVANTNTSTTVNINVNALGNKTLLNNDGTSPLIGSIRANTIIDVMYDGTNFVLLRTSGTSYIGTGLFGDGSVGAPAVAFAADTDTGLYRTTTNDIEVALGGVQAFSFNANGCGVRPGGGVFFSTDGAVGNPGFQFGADSDTGLYRPTNNTLAIAAGGVQVFSISASQMLFPDGAVGTPGAAFLADTDTGFYRTTTNDIEVALAGTQAFSFNPNGCGVRAGGGVFFTTDGVVNNPGIQYLSDSDTGFYRSASGTINVACDSTNSAIFTAGSLRLVDGASNLPAFSFISDTDTGFYRSGANNMRLQAGANTYLNVDGSASNAVVLGLNSSTDLGFNCSTAGSATAGAATLPANPASFIVFRINGTQVKVPYYNT